MKSLQHYYDEVVVRSRTTFRRFAFRSARNKLLHSPELSDEQKQVLARCSLRTYRGDEMYAPGHEETYLRVGASAMLCVEVALERGGGAERVQSILDFPCGHGRVLRMLRARFPQAEITAGDLEPSMLAFAQQEFDATPFQSHADIENLSIGKTFDLIWCGSLVTHLEPEQTTQLLRFFYNHLNPGGVCLFSSHGDLSAMVIEIYGLSKKAEETVLAGYHESGYGYAEYDDFALQDYGVSIISYERMTQMASEIGDWHEVLFAQYGWDRHHDVYAYVKG